MTATDKLAKRIVRTLGVCGDQPSGIDVGSRTAFDMEHLNYAEEENRVVVAYDNDFLKLHEAGRPHAGDIFKNLAMPASIIEKRTILRKGRFFL
ncbi:MAG: DUF5615 family PIN-like protein [Lewinellaceae bacterium]|nr:DUF5615 family PIN-like protein [Lewinellaceae bacterium]